MWPDVDPRSLGDGALFRHLLLGDLPKAGWNRRRAIVNRFLELLAIAIATAIVLRGLWLLLLFVLTLAAPR